MKGVRKKAEGLVSDITEPFITTVDFEDHIFKAIYEMNSHKQNLPPVLKDNEVVGIVRYVEVFHKVAELLR